MYFRGGLPELLRQVNRMQSKLEKLKEELKQRTVIGESGGGIVKVKINGGREVVSIEFEDKVMAEGKTVLQDLIIAATNDALRKVEELIEQETEKITKGFKFPGLL